MSHALSVHLCFHFVCSECLNKSVVLNWFGVSGLWNLHRVEGGKEGGRREGGREGGGGRRRKHEHRQGPWLCMVTTHWLVHLQCWDLQRDSHQHWFMSAAPLTVPTSNAPLSPRTTSLDTPYLVWYGDTSGVWLGEMEWNGL